MRESERVREREREGGRREGGGRENTDVSILWIERVKNN